MPVRALVPEHRIEPLVDRVLMFKFIEGNNLIFVMFPRFIRFFVAARDFRLRVDRSASAFISVARFF